MPLTNYIAVAEHAWALILDHLKRLPAGRDLMRGREYTGTWGYVPGARLARGLTLGLLGLGEIARPMARMAAAFEMRAIYWDVARFPEVEARYGVEYVGWDEIFRRSDILSLQLALNERTAGIVGAREIGLLRTDALFVNTARGRLVDQGALVAALRARRIGGAALDVYAEEPLPADDPLHELHERPEYGVTLTPHAASLAPLDVGAGLAGALAERPARPARRADRASGVSGLSSLSCGVAARTFEEGQDGRATQRAGAVPDAGLSSRRAGTGGPPRRDDGGGAARRRGPDRRPQ